MAEPQDQEMTLEDDYDEEADSDFEAGGSGAEDVSSASDDDEQHAENSSERPRKRRKTDKAPTELITELDSGDEATIREQRKTRKKDKNATCAAPEGDGNESEGWRAHTRAMRTREKQEQRRK